MDDSTEKRVGRKAARLLSKPTNGLVRQIDPDTLDLGIKIERVPAHFATVARLFEAAKRRGGIEHIEGVNPDNSCFDVPGKTMSSRYVTRPDAG